MEEEIPNEDEETGQFTCYSCGSYKIRLLTIQFNSEMNFNLNLLCEDCGLLLETTLQRSVINLETFETQPIKSKRKKK